MEKERLRFCIDRFDHYYDSINNKCAVFLALGTFVVGGLIASYPYLEEKINFTIFIYSLLALPILMGLLSIILVLVATTPYLSSKKASIYYFNSIAIEKERIFVNNSKNFDSDMELSDLRRQVHGLATGLRKKFYMLRVSGILFTLMFLCIIPLLTMIIINIK
ncbi:MAG: DUF5706 domain-containing protein [Bacteroidales bacterium]|nr:DUF5706 domain-containing protein [Bacteroidales bacterium]